MKDIILRLTSSIDQGNSDDPQHIEMVTAGKLSIKDGCATIRYDESELSGMEGLATELTVCPDSISMVRYMKESPADSMPAPTMLHFVQNKEFGTDYRTPYGRIELMVHTDTIIGAREFIENEGINSPITIDYQIMVKSFGGISHNIMNIERLQ